MAFFFPQRRNPNYEGQKNELEIKPRRWQGNDEGSKWWRQVCWCLSLDLWVGFLILVDDVSLWVFEFLDCWWFLSDSLDFVGFVVVDGVLLRLDFVGFVVVDGVLLHLDSLDFLRVAGFAEKSSSANSICCIGNWVQWARFNTPKSSLLHSRC